MINFNDLDYREQPLEQALTNHLDRLAAENQTQLRAEHYKEKSPELIVRLSAEQKIVLLIDEYDRPITDLLENEEKVAEHVAASQELLLSAGSDGHQPPALDPSDRRLQIRQALPLLRSEQSARHHPGQALASLVGYTQEELERYFPDRIEALAEHFTRSAGSDGRGHPLLVQRLLLGRQDNALRTLFYTGLFQLQSFENHWFATGTPSFLIKLLRQKQLPAYTLERMPRRQHTAR